MDAIEPEGQWTTIRPRWTVRFATTNLLPEQIQAKHQFKIPQQIGRGTEVGMNLYDVEAWDFTKYKNFKIVLSKAMPEHDGRTVYVT